MLNESIKSVDKTSDFKFSMFEIYANVVIDAFNHTKETDGRVLIENTSNIDILNDVFVLENSFMKTKVEQFSLIVNLFNQYYHKCNKMMFASNLSSNIEKVTSEQQVSNEKVATYYFKEIYGI